MINRRGGDGRFAESDAHLLQVLASSAALAIANARMAESLVEHERVRRELELAAEIQRTLLPSPRPDPFPVCGVNIPARTVSGDFYDIVPLEGSRIAFCLGDVAGKGMNAALLMAKTASLYRCLAKTTESPGALLATLDREICETATRGIFVTMLAGLYDPARGEVTLANAGHEPALLHGLDGEFVSLPASAPPLGIEAGGEFPEIRVSMKGGTLYVCSDGLTEAACAESRERAGQRGPEAADPPLRRQAALRADRGDHLGRGPTRAARRSHPARRLGRARPALMAGPDGAAPLELRFPARPDELRGMRDALRERLRAWRLDEACATRRRDGGGRGLPERDPPRLSRASRTA